MVCSITSTQYSGRAGATSIAAAAASLSATTPAAISPIADDDYAFRPRISIAHVCMHAHQLTPQAYAWLQHVYSKKSWDE